MVVVVGVVAGLVVLVVLVVVVVVVLMHNMVGLVNASPAHRKVVSTQRQRVRPTTTHVPRPTLPCVYCMQDPYGAKGIAIRLQV